METQILEFKNESPEEIENRINEFVQHYEVKDIEVVGRDGGFLVMIFYDEGT